MREREMRERDERREMRERERSKKWTSKRTVRLIESGKLVLT